MQKVLIIGAGLSGLYLATLLEEKYEVIILEARPRVGGRVFSIDGHDLGPSWIWPHHKQMLSLVSSMGLELFMQHTQGDALYDTKESVQRFNPPPASPSARVKGSLSALIEALHVRLKNTQICLSTEVLGIREDEDGVHVRSVDNEFHADYVISTLPPRLAASLEFEPPLPNLLKAKMINTQTWMGNSAKCVIEFRSAFWREQGLSGFCFSHAGPLGEIHDASLEDVPALFGFVSANTQMDDFETKVKEQLILLFGIDEDEIVAIYTVDWKMERFSASHLDAQKLSQHPQYGIDTSVYSKKILFSATEFSFVEGGYLEGALRCAELVAKSL